VRDLVAFTIVGIVTGSIYAIAASGLVVTYTTSGVFNFAHGAIGMVSAFLYWQVKEDWGLGTWPALILVLLVFAPLFGLFLERVLMRPLAGKPTGVSLVVTVGLLVLLFAITYLDRVCISVAGPRMQEDLGIDPIGWGWVTGMFTLAYCLFEIPTGATPASAGLGDGRDDGRTGGRAHRRRSAQLQPPVPHAARGQRLRGGDPRSPAQPPPHVLGRPHAGHRRGVPHRLRPARLLR